MFEEVLADEEEDRHEQVPVVVAEVQPKQCGALLNELQELLPLKEVALGHLRRVKKVQDADANGAPKLLVLLTSEKAWASLPADTKLHITSSYSTVVSHGFEVPRYPSSTRAEYEIASRIWPMSFHPSTTIERENVSAEELSSMLNYLSQALEDAQGTSFLLHDNSGCSFSGGVIVDPALNSVIAAAGTIEMLAGFPFQHTAMRCIEGVALRDRKKRLQLSSGHRTTGEPTKPPPKRALNSAPSSTISNGGTTADNSYLCTGYDIYLLREPCIMCAMALLHSRIRRVAYALSNPETGALGSQFKLHSNRALNHHFRVFQCTDSKLLRDVTALMSAKDQLIGNNAPQSRETEE